MDDLTRAPTPMIPPVVLAGLPSLAWAEVDESAVLLGDTGTRNAHLPSRFGAATCEQHLGVRPASRSSLVTS